MQAAFQPITFRTLFEPICRLYFRLIQDCSGAIINGVRNFHADDTASDGMIELLFEQVFRPKKEELLFEQMFRPKKEELLFEQVFRPKKEELLFEQVRVCIEMMDFAMMDFCAKSDGLCITNDELQSSMRMGMEG